MFADRFKTHRRIEGVEAPRDEVIATRAVVKMIGPQSPPKEGPSANKVMRPYWDTRLEWTQKA